MVIKTLGLKLEEDLQCDWSKPFWLDNEVQCYCGFTDILSVQQSAKKTKLPIVTCLSQPNSEPKVE